MRSRNKYFRGFRPKITKPKIELKIPKTYLINDQLIVVGEDVLNLLLSKNKDMIYKEIKESE
jgi:hypothetical protein